MAVRITTRCQRTEPYLSRPAITVPEHLAWQPYNEFGVGPHLAINRNSAAMLHCDDVVGDRQAEVVATLRVALLRPRGHGRIRLVSADPLTPPRIDANFAADTEDMRRLVAGLRLAWQVIKAPAMATAYQRVACLDETTISSDADLTNYVRAHVGTYCHTLGTMPIGHDADPNALLDQHCRVRGIDGLSVVDASVIPIVPRVVGHLTVIMIAERAAMAGWRIGTVTTLLFSLAITFA